MAAVAMDIGEREKYESYVARLPKRDRRSVSRASAQTVWIQEAVSEWYGFYVERMASLGLPRENTLHRAGLMLPRAPMGNVVPMMPEPPELAAAVEEAFKVMQPSRTRVLIKCEKCAEHGIARAAHELGMSVKATSRYLDEGRQSLADTLRGMGWKVPQK